MKPEQIAELRRLDAAAKQPPWVAEGGYVYPGDPEEVEREAIWIFGTDDCAHPPTAVLIISMRNAFKQLLDEREALLKAAKDLASIVMYNEISDEQIALGQAAEAAIAKAEAP